jgi:hypothetical protein
MYKRTGLDEGRDEKGETGGKMLESTKEVERTKLKATEG